MIAAHVDAASKLCQSVAGRNNNAVSQDECPQTTIEISHEPYELLEESILAVAKLGNHRLAKKLAHALDAPT